MPGGLPRVQLQRCLPSFFSFKFRVSNFKFQVDISFCLLPSAFCLLPSAYCLLLCVSSLNLPTTCISSGGANSYASQVTTGVTRKFSVGGGEAVRHSSPGKCQGFASACL